AAWPSTGPRARASGGGPRSWGVSWPPAHGTGGQRCRPLVAWSRDVPGHAWIRGGRAPDRGASPAWAPRRGADHLGVHPGEDAAPVAALLRGAARIHVAAGEGAVRPAGLRPAARAVAGVRARRAVAGRVHRRGRVAARAGGRGDAQQAGARGAGVPAARVPREDRAGAGGAAGVPAQAGGGRRVRWVVAAAGADQAGAVVARIGAR